MSFHGQMGRAGRDQIFTLLTAFGFYGRGQGVNQLMNTDCDV